MNGGIRELPGNSVQIVEILLSFYFSSHYGLCPNFVLKTREEYGILNFLLRLMYTEVGALVSQVRHSNKGAHALLIMLIHISADVSHISCDR